MAVRIAELTAIISADSSSFDSAMGNASNSIERLAGGAALMTAGKAIGGFLADTIGVAAGVEQQVDFVSAALGGLNDVDLSRVNDQMMEIGASSQYSTQEVGAAMEQMAKSGVPLEMILGGATQAVVDLAAATGEDLSASGQHVAQMSSMFGIAGEDINKVADITTNAMNESALSLADLQKGMTYLGPEFSQLAQYAGEPVEAFNDANAALAYFNTLGLKGAEAGVSLSRGLGRLADPSSDASKEMARLGISAFDLEGNMLPLPDILDQLQVGLGDADDQTKKTALGLIFGAEAVDVMTLAVAKGGDGLRDMEADMAVQGSAADQAAIRMDNFNGSLEKMGGAIDAAKGALGKGFLEPLRGIVDAVAGAATAFSELPPEVLGVIGAFTAAAGAVALLAGAFVLLPVIIGPIAAGFAALASAAAVLAPVLALIGLGIAAYKNNWFGFADAVHAVGDAFGRAVDETKYWIDQGVNPLSAAMAGLAGGIETIFGDNMVSNWLRDTAEKINGLGPAVRRVGNEFQYWRDQGINPVSAALAGLAGGIETVFGDNMMSNWLRDGAEALDLFLPRFALMNDLHQQVGNTPAASALMAFGDALLHATGVDITGFTDGLANFANVVGTAFSDLGTALRGLDLDIGGKLSAVGTTLARIGEAIQATDFSGVGAAFSTLGATIARIGEAMSTWDIGGKFSALGTTLATIGERIQSLDLGTVFSTLGTTLAVAGESIGAAFETIGSALATLGEALPVDVGETLRRITDALSGIDIDAGVGASISAIGGAFNLLGTGLATIGETGGALIGRVVQALTGMTVDAAAGAALSAVGSGFNILGTALATIGEAGGAIIGRITQALSGLDIDAAAGAAMSAIGAGFSALGTALATIGEAGGALIGRVVQALTGMTVDAAAGAALSAIGSGFSTLGTALTTIGEAGGALIGRVAQALSGLSIDAAAGAAMSAIGAGFSSLGTALATIGEAGGATIQRIVQALTGLTVDAAVGAAMTAIGAGFSALGTGLALVGEAGGGIIGQVASALSGLTVPEGVGGTLSDVGDALGTIGSGIGSVADAGVDCLTTLVGALSSLNLSATVGAALSAVGAGFSALGTGANLVGETGVTVIGGVASALSRLTVDEAVGAAISAVGDGFNALGTGLALVGEAGGTILNTAASALSRLDVDAAVGGAILAVGEGFNTLGTGLSLVGETGASILGSLSTALSGLSVPDGVGAAMVAVADGIIAIGGALGATKDAIASAGGDFFSFLGQSMAQFGELGDSVIPDGGDAASDPNGMGLAFGKEIAAVFSSPEFVAGIEEGLTSAPTEAFAGIGQAMVTKFNEGMAIALREPMTGLGGASPTDPTGMAPGGGMAATILNGFAQQVEAGAASVDPGIFAAAAAAVMAKFQEGISNAFSGGGGNTMGGPGERGGVGGTGQGMGLEFVTAWAQSVAASISSAGEEVFAPIKAAISAKFNEVMSSLSTVDSTGGPGERGEAGTGIGAALVASIVEQVNSADWSAMTMTFQTKATEAMEGFATGITTGMAAAVTAVMGAKDQMLATLTAMSTEATTAGQAAGQGFADGITTGTAAAITAVMGAVDQMMASLSAMASEATAAGTAAGTGFQSGIVSGMAAAISSVQGAVAQITATLASAAAGAEAAGAAVGAGFAAGIQSQLGAVQSAAASLVAAAQVGLEAAAQIASPSKLFAKLGGYIGEGFVNGIMAKIEAARGAGAGLSEAATAGATEAMRAEKPLSIGEQIGQGFWQGMLDTVPDTIGAARFLVRMAVKEADGMANKLMAKSRGQGLLAEFYRKEFEAMDPWSDPAEFVKLQQKMFEHEAQAQSLDVSAINQQAADAKREMDKAISRGGDRDRVQALRAEYRLLQQLADAQHRAYSAPDDSAAAEIAAMKVQYIQQKLEDLAGLDVGGAIGTDLSQGMNTAMNTTERATNSMTSDMESVGSTAEEVGGSITDSFKGGVQSAQTAVSDAMSKIHSKLGTGGAMGEQAGTQMMNGVGSGVSQGTPDVQSMIDDIWSKATGGATSGGREVGQDFTSGLGTSLPNAATLADRIMADIERGFEGMGKIGTSSGRELGGGFASGLGSSNAPNAATRLLNQTTNNILTGGSDAAQAAGDAGLDIGNSLNTGVSRGGGDAIRTAGQVQNRIQNTLSGTFSKVNLGQVNTGGVVNSVKNTLNSIGNINSSGTGTKIGASLGTGIQSGVRDKTSAIRDQVLSAVNAAGTVNTSGGSTLGSTFGQGLASGAASKGSVINTAVKKLVDDAYKAGMDAAKSKSPSRLFMGMGEFFSLGMAIGITDETGAVTGAMRDLVADTAAEARKFDGSLGAVGLTGDGANGGTTAPAPTVVNHYHAYEIRDAKFESTDDFQTFFENRSQETAVSVSRS